MTTMNYDGKPETLTFDERQAKALHLVSVMTGKTLTRGVKTKTGYFVDVSRVAETYTREDIEHQAIVNILETYQDEDLALGSNIGPDGRASTPDITRAVYRTAIAYNNDNGGLTEVPRALARRRSAWEKTEGLQFEEVNDLTADLMSDSGGIAEIEDNDRVHFLIAAIRDMYNSPEEAQLTLDAIADRLNGIPLSDAARKRLQRLRPKLAAFLAHEREDEEALVSSGLADALTDLFAQPVQDHERDDSIHLGSDFIDDVSQQEAAHDDHRPVRIGRRQSAYTIDEKPDGYGNKAPVNLSDTHGHQDRQLNRNPKRKGPVPATYWDMMMAARKATVARRDKELAQEQKELRRKWDAMPPLPVSIQPA